MNMLNLTKPALEAENALIPGINQHIQRVVNAIPFATVADSMKATIAVSHITNFAAQFRRNIKLWDDTLVPINAISFIITSSGAGKDSSNRTAQKCFTSGYNKIEAYRKQLVIKQAIEAAKNAGDEPCTEFDIYKSYMKPLPPIDMAITTGPGLIQHINDLGDLDISSGFIYTGEFSDELAYNSDMLENIKILSETYDLGIKEMKYTKGVEHRSKAINGQPISALFIGSPGHILYDKATKDKFHIAFMSKLARRSWFCYAPERIPEPVFDTLDAMLEFDEAREITAKQARASMSNYVDDITNFGLSTTKQDITVSKDVFKLFNTYKRYNSDLVDLLPNQESTYALIRRHLQWKALKLAGAFALFEKSNEIQKNHYVDAIRFCELLDEDMLHFERDLNKSIHERFADYVKTLPLIDGKTTISIHDIKKNGFITTVTNTKLQELIHLCSGYDHDGVYSIVDEGSAIRYEAIIKTDILGISYKAIDCTSLNTAVASNNYDAIRSAKHNISSSAVKGFTTGDTTFADLTNLLSGDFAYSPFKFHNGIRAKENITAGAKWLVLDVDKSPITIHETHFMLSDINHHVALSSDPNNLNKYRVLIELDAIVDLSPVAWKHFYLAIADELGIPVDPVPQSQIFFSYADRLILSTIDAQPLSAHKYIVFAKEQEQLKSHKDKQVTPAQAKALLSDKLTTFSYAFDAPNGTGSRNVIRAIYHLKTLGGTLSDALELYNDIQEYWDVSFTESRSQAMIDQITRLF